MIDTDKSCQLPIQFQHLRAVYELSVGKNPGYRFINLTFVCQVLRLEIDELHLFLGLGEVRGLDPESPLLL